MTGHRTTALIVVIAGGIVALLLHGAAVRATPNPVALLAFETPAGIQLIGSDGSGLRRLPGTKRGDQNPRWSPDGTRIVFWTDAEWDGEIYVVNADGSNRRRLTEDDPESDYYPTDQFPTWSPDGRLIAFESFRSGAWHIWLMRADGTGVRRLTPDARGGYSPHWSADGKQLIYTPTTSWASFGIVDMAGRTHALKTFDNDWSASWSPDGAWIAFTSRAEHKKPELYVVSAEGGTPSRLTRNTAADFDPLWSPDGQHIVFTSSRAGLDEVYVMRADGTDHRRVTRNPTEYACCADWRPGT